MATKYIQVKVDHTGACPSELTGKVHNYVSGKAVKLPEDVVSALGEAVTILSQTKQMNSAPKDKMVKEAEVSK